MIATAVSFALAATVQAAAKDGTYEGTANGKNGPLTVQVVIKNSKIASVKVLKSGETAMVSDAAMERVPAEIVKTQSLRVDNVAGATLTSMAIQAAATNAVKAAGGQPSEYYKKPSCAGPRRRIRCRCSSAVTDNRGWRRKAFPSCGLLRAGTWFRQKGSCREDGLAP